MMGGPTVCFHIIFVLQILWRCGKGAPHTIVVGGVFEENHVAQKLAFIHAMKHIKLHKGLNAQYKVDYRVFDTQNEDLFDAHKKVCQHLGRDQGVAAVFGPISSLSAAHVESICDSYNIPHIQTNWNDRDIRDYFSISLYPHYLTLSKAYQDIIRYWKWEVFTILYENNEGLIRMQELLKGTKSDGYRVTVRKLEPLGGKYGTLFKELKDKGESRFVIDCHYSRCAHILHEASTADMLTAYFHFHFATLDLDLVDLGPFREDEANITAYRLVDPRRKQVSDLIYDWSEEETKTHISPLMGKQSIETEVALMYDAVHLFDRALTNIDGLRTKSFSCSSSGSWDYGSKLLSYMKSIDFEGLTGHIGYERGERTNFKLDLVQHTERGLKNIGKWTNATGANVTVTFKKKLETSLSLKNRPVRVAVKLSEPYVMLIKDKNGDDKYVGFCIDLLDEIAKVIPFNYTITEVDDFGSNSTNGEWNGLVRELMTRRADIGLTSLTITSERDDVVDFTKPFLSIGITILFRKPEDPPIRIFSFMSPLSLEVWIYMLAAYLCVSVMLYMIARFSPDEWCNPYPCNPDDDIVENQFSILNSLWFTIGALMQQGCEIAPRATSTRLVSALWWFFTLIMISSYTANLAAFLTVTRMSSPITSADDLAKQTVIKFGSTAGGSTQNFFKNSNIPTYKKMWNFMSAHPEVFVDNATAGRDWVLRGGYAFLAESTDVEYMSKQNCSLMQVGGELDSKGYGIATPNGSPFREDLSNTILKLAEDQVIHGLKRKWWKQKHKCPGDGETVKAASSTEMGIQNVGGVFIVLLAGVVMGFLVSLCEFTWKAHKNAKKDQQSICSEITEELRFIMKCFGSNTKPVKKPVDESIDNGITFPLTGYVPTEQQEVFT